MTQEGGERPRLAAIDVGTNSIRLVIAEVEEDGTYRVLDEDRDMTRLGRGLYEAGRLGRQPMERSLGALCKMRAIADGFGVRDLRVVATSAVRDASNGRDFRNEAKRRCGVRVEVIGADDEARLAFASVNRHFQLDGRSVAVVDIGGGSVEVILAAGGVIHNVYSLPLGAVRLFERYHRSDPLKRKHWKKLKRAIDKTIKQTIGRPAIYPEVMVGSGGTFTNLGEMVQYEREGRLTQIRGYAVSRAELVSLLGRLRETPLGTRRRLPSLNPKRADIIVAGAAAVVRLAKYLRTQQILVNDRGIRDGLLLSMIEELGLAGARTAPAAESRMDWVRAFARQCRSNERHCYHVAMLAMRLFDQLREPFELPAAGRDLLEAAALLHDVGYLINHAKHHKHAFHLIMHGDLRGFSPGEVELIANVVRYHRRAMPTKSHENFRRLDRSDRTLVRQLSGILRVADGLDRTHGQAVRDVTVELDHGVLRLVAEAEQNPSIELDDARRKSKLCAASLDATLEFAWTGERRARRRTARRSAR